MIVNTHTFLFIENEPCLGSRKPNQPYEWLSYKEVRIFYSVILLYNKNVF